MHTRYFLNVNNPIISLTYVYECVAFFFGFSFPPVFRVSHDENKKNSICIFSRTFGTADCRKVKIEVNFLFFF